MPSLCTTMALGLHLATAHFDTHTPHNDINPGVYVTCDSYAAGFYRNSQWRNSAYAGYVLHENILGTEIDVLAGAVTGYKGMPVAPMLIPSMKVGDHLRLSLIPPVKIAQGGGIHMSWGVVMPCYMSPDEIADCERISNKEKHGVDLPDAKWTGEVACQVTRLIDDLGLLYLASPLVRAWYEKHSEEDRKAGRR